MKIFNYTSIRNIKIVEYDQPVKRFYFGQERQKIFFFFITISFCLVSPRCFCVRESNYLT